MSISPKKVADDAFDTMWEFLEMGKQKSNYPALKEHCLKLRQMMMQKTAGQRNKPKDIPFEDLDMLKNFIVIEALTLVLSGDAECLMQIHEIKAEGGARNDQET